MSFNRLDIDGEDVPPGQNVRIVRANILSWWDRPATAEAYVAALLIITLGVLAGLFVA
jgi:hypothetical protein